MAFPGEGLPDLGPQHIFPLCRLPNVATPDEHTRTNGLHCKSTFIDHFVFRFLCKAWAFCTDPGAFYLGFHLIAQPHTDRNSTGICTLYDSLFGVNIARAFAMSVLVHRLRRIGPWSMYRNNTALCNILNNAPLYITAYDSSYMACIKHLASFGARSSFFLEPGVGRSCWTPVPISIIPYLLFASSLPLVMPRHLFHRFFVFFSCFRSDTTHMETTAIAQCCKRHVVRRDFF